MSKSDDHPASVREELTLLAERASELGMPRKTKAVLEVLEKFEGKLIVFCEYTATVDHLVDTLRARGITTTSFTGRLTAKAKQAALVKFRGDVRVLVTSRAGGEGLNIQFCQNMVNYDLPWNPMAVEQRIGRVHRLGQEKEVNVINLAVKDTIEARVLELLTHKIQLFQSVIGEIDLILGNLDSDKGFEQLLQEFWVKAQVEGKEGDEFRTLGNQLEYARTQFEEVKDNAEIMDRFAPQEN
jgi:SNF2 family DNA or RNA helicase